MTIGSSISETVAPESYDTFYISVFVSCLKFNVRCGMIIADIIQYIYLYN